MRLVYTSDLHGNLDKYRHLLELAVVHQAQAVLVGGDLLPHTIRIAEAVPRQRSFIENDLRPLLHSFRVSHPDIAVYLLPGNDDWAAAIQTLNGLENERLTYPLHERVYRLNDDLWLSGCAWVPITPFSIKDYERHDGGDIPPYSFAMAYTSTGGHPEKTSIAALLRQPTIAAELETLAQRSNPVRTIYVTHAPPYDTALDMRRRGKHLGSHALRAFIEHHQPFLTLHGHIHESPRESGRYAEQLGTTWSINPGSEREHLNAVVLDTADIAGTLWHTIYGALPQTQHS